MPDLRIWALLGHRLGDNNQVLALAEALGLPFEIKHLEYNCWRHLRPGLLGASILSLTRDSRARISDEPPDLTISTGIRSVPAVQWLRQRSGGRTRSVHLGYPRLSPGMFDLVVATPEYPIDDHPRLLRIPFALTRQQGDEADQRLETEFPTPRRLMILGGPTLYWSLDEAMVIANFQSLCQQALSDGGSVLVVGSPRTPGVLLEALRRRIEEAPVRAELAPMAGPPSYGALLRAADEIYVTADSVAMVSDAIVTEKPVALIPIERSGMGRVYLGLMDQLRPGRRVRPRDLRFFWRELYEQKLVGTLGQLYCGKAPHLSDKVAAHVRTILGAGQGPG